MPFLDRKIVCDESLDSEESKMYIPTVDGTDCKVFGKKHFCFIQDKKQFTKKHQHGSLKYEIAISVQNPTLCGWMDLTVVELGGTGVKFLKSQNHFFISKLLC